MFLIRSLIIPIFHVTLLNALITQKPSGNIINPSDNLHNIYRQCKTNEAAEVKCVDTNGACRVRLDNDTLEGLRALQPFCMCYAEYSYGGRRCEIMKPNGVSKGKIAFSLPKKMLSLLRIPICKSTAT